MGDNSHFLIGQVLFRNSKSLHNLFKVFSQPTLIIEVVIFMAKILVVEDEQRVSELVTMYLKKEGFEVEQAFDGEEALRKLHQRPFDLVILDIMLPGKDGFEVCREVRQFSKVPIIMLTARDEEIDRVVGLEIGADDYIPKPFSPREMVARVKAVLRRVNNSEETQRQAARYLSFPGFSIDLDAYEVKAGNITLELTPKEFELLAFLAQNPHRVFNREELLERVWGYDFAGDSRTVDAHIKRIRKKFSDAGFPAPIKTVWGVGYRFEIEKP